MDGEVLDISPTIAGVIGDGFSGSGKVYNSNTLYKKHQLYYGALSGDVSPSVGCVEDISPTLYSIINE